MENVLSEIKLDGLLKFPQIKCVDLKLNTLLVSSTNVKGQCLKISEDRKVKFYDGDMHIVLVFLLNQEALVVLVRALMHLFIS